MTKKTIHSKITNSDLKREFPDLESLMKSKSARKNSAKKKNYKKQQQFYNERKEQNENNGSDSC